MKVSSKSQNRVDEYEGIIKDLHDRNIAIEGNFVFGFDEDDPLVFDVTADFVINNGIDLPEFYVLTPYPGTKLFERLHSEGRIVDKNWSHYDNTHFHFLPVFTPKKMSRDDLRAGCKRAEWVTYSYRNTIRRIRRSGICRGPVLLANLIYASRIASRNSLVPLGEQIEGETDAGHQLSTCGLTNLGEWNEIWRDTEGTEYFPCR